MKNKKLKIIWNLEKKNVQGFYDSKCSTPVLIAANKHQGHGLFTRECIYYKSMWIKASVKYIYTSQMASFDPNLAMVSVCIDLRDLNCKCFPVKRDTTIHLTVWAACFVEK